jgi:DNA polymerase elongation subunit (family B)
MGMKTKLHDMVSALKKLAKSLDKTPTVVEFMKETGISNRSIYDNGSYEDLCVKAGLQLHKEPLAVEARPPKILFIDIETAPIKAYAYGIWDQNISAQQIIKDWFMISWAARWLGEEEVMYADSRKRKDVSNDKAICKKIHKLLCEADIIVGHNVAKFDIKKLNTRFLKHGLTPIGKKQVIDTLKIARKYFKITSNKLEFIANFLGIEGKYKSKTYSGYKLWIACCEKNMEAYKENEIYNKQDIEVTEAVFHKLKAWDETLNFQSISQKIECICGGTKFIKYGFAHTKVGAYQKHRCANAECGKVVVSRYNSLTKGQRAGVTFK